MSKAKPATQKLARPETRKERRRISVWLYALVGGLVLAIAIGVPLYLNQSSQSSPAPSFSLLNQSSQSLPASIPPGPGAPLTVAAVGKPAPGFSLPNQYRQPYTLTPGDGKNHVLVFYMGYF